MVRKATGDLGNLHIKVLFEFNKPDALVISS